MRLLCKDCQQLLPVSDYYDSNKSRCKECVKARVRKYRAENIERINAYDRERGRLPHRKALKKALAHRYDHKARSRAFIEANPHKRAAHIMVGNYIRDGKLIPQPCEWCGANDDIHAHHEDYSKPLDVMWLCRSCHGARHRQINEERRQQEAG